MKKRITALLLCMMMVVSLAACAGDKPAQDSVEADSAKVSEERRSNIIETDSETGEKYYLLGDFENYWECTQVKNEATFGKITQITSDEQPDMVTYGKQSVKLEIQGTEETWNQRWPQLRFATSTAFFNLTTDFSNMTKLTFDIYNDMDYAIDMSVYPHPEVYPRSTMQDRILTNDNYEYCITTRIVLEPKQWNHIEIPAGELKAIKYDTDLKPYLVYGADALQTVGAFVMKFQRGEGVDDQQVFYLDNVRAYFNEDNK